METGVWYLISNDGCMDLFGWVVLYRTDMGSDPFA
jgi:hypothetical protein